MDRREQFYNGNNYRQAKKCDCTNLNSQTQMSSSAHSGTLRSLLSIPCASAKGWTLISEKPAHHSVTVSTSLLTLSTCYSFLTERCLMCQYVTKEWTLNTCMVPCVALVRCPFIANQMNNLHNPVLPCTFTKLPFLALWMHGPPPPFLSFVLCRNRSSFLANVALIILCQMLCTLGDVELKI